MWSHLQRRKRLVIPNEWQSYNHIIRKHPTVCHAEHDWAQADDGDGIREVHTNSAEAMWTDVRNYLHPFKGVYKVHCLARGFALRLHMSLDNIQVY